VELDEVQVGDLIELSPGGRAFRQSDLIHIIRDPSIAPLVGAGEAWVGLANLSGNLIPVADLGILDSGRPGEGKMMLAIRADGVSFGLLCEGVIRTCASPPEDGLVDERLPGDPDWLLASPPGEPRLIDPALLLEDPRLGPIR
jgi:hypothetical protein